jgi:hypothetical protein
MVRQESLGALGGGAALEFAFASFGATRVAPTGLLKPSLDGIAVLGNLCQIKNSRSDR